MMHLPEFLYRADPRNWKKPGVPKQTRAEDISTMQALVDSYPIPESEKVYAADIPSPMEMAKRFVTRSPNVYHTIQCIVLWLEQDAASGSRNLRDTFRYVAVHQLNDHENEEVKSQFRRNGWLIESELLLAKERFQYTLQYPRSCYTPEPMPQ